MSNSEITYKLDMESISSTFKFKENGLTHSQGNKLNLLPYTANEKTLVSNFDGVVGAFSRIISNKQLKSDLNIDEFVENVIDQVGDFEGATSKEVFKDIIKTIFIDKGSLIDFDIKTINYIPSSKAEEKIASFLYSIFFDDTLRDLVKKHYDKKVDNILYKLVLNALPDLVEKQYSIDMYLNYLPFIKELFIKDFEFLIQHEELYKNSLKRFLEYYYMFYVSQLSMKLSNFEKADLTRPEKIYYSLSWESLSKNRTAYKFGWDLLKNSVNSLFSHAITLEFLNHHGMNKQLGYVELYNLFQSDDQKLIADQIEHLYQEYTKRIKDKEWSQFKYNDIDSGNEAFNKVYKLFNAIEYQFQKSSRTRAYEAYKNWYIKFVQDNFAKRRGALGYCLNITEEDIILMTKICIKKDEKLKLSVLFEKFERRGLFFDKDSKIKIIQLFEKLNLLEKKSDSGDAQYVRSVL
ncbi:DNA phosphorothioation-dependent restriction protein DptG [Clostridium sp. N3C]|uniref:DNA phosphorothioation-dependent restriction protein DptG n=1 Tax=Clostridium sp. N3C TaxID=1776758 RepID=UPI00092E1CB1|nr:DNA phosphorothioation-dependent restriction protein DptG [Clostridium sp. N3C]SCN26408.1 DNA phosphorothioation-dependent restriction protein DptG [Clostridium sp. N3C]